MAEIADELTELEAKEEEYAAEIKKRMMVIPQIIDASVPIGKDDSENVQNERIRRAGRAGLSRSPIMWTSWRA